MRADAENILDLAAQTFCARDRGNTGVRVKAMKSLFTLIPCKVFVLLLCSCLTSYAQPKSDIPLSKYATLLTSENWYTGFDSAGEKQTNPYFYLAFTKGHSLKELDGTLSCTEYSADGSETPYSNGVWKLDGNKLTLDFEHDPDRVITIEFVRDEHGTLLVKENGKTYWHPER